MTTSFSHFVRGEFVSAARANPAGLLLAAVCAAMIPWSWISIYTRTWWRVSNPETAAFMLILAVILVTLLQWGARAMMG